tara:strand:+ start:1745 stop:2380 length:636 start_codon:yes stop_codon:yes gene_type:complete
MAEIKNIIPATPANVLPTFNFTDLSAATYKTVYGMKDFDTLYLTGQQIDSDIDKLFTLEVANGADAKLGEVNFDLSFGKITQFVKGLCWINSTIEMGSSGGNTTTAYFKLRALHVDGASAETEIASQVTTNQTNTATAGGIKRYRYLSTLDISRTVFISGEKLRIEVEIWGSTTSGNANVILWHDGSNRNTSTTDAHATNFIVQVPFEVDI